MIPSALSPLDTRTLADIAALRDSLETADKLLADGGSPEVVRTLLLGSLARLDALAVLVVEGA